jgi:hypothetical protein
LNDLWVFNHSSSAWTLLNRNENFVDADPATKRIVPKKRKGAAMCGVEGIMLLLFGGLSRGGLLSDTWIYSISSRTWLPLNSHRQLPKSQIIHPSARTAVFHWCLHDKMIVHGGAVSHTALASDFWEFSLHDLVWKELRTASPPHLVAVVLHGLTVTTCISSAAVRMLHQLLQISESTNRRSFTTICSCSISPT